MATITIHHGTAETQLVLSSSKGTVFGRGPFCMFPEAENYSIRGIPRVSREHLLIEQMPDGNWIAADLASSFGTVVNDSMIRIASLGDGDVLSVPGVQDLRLTMRIDGPAQLSSSDAAAEEPPSPVQCSVCMGPMVRPLSLNCGHTFCVQCMQRALTVKPACPLCRASVEGPPVRVRLLDDLVNKVSAESLAYQSRRREVQIDELVSKVRILKMKTQARACKKRGIPMMNVLDDLSAAHRAQFQGAMKLLQGEERFVYVQSAGLTPEICESGINITQLLTFMSNTGIELDDMAPEQRLAMYINFR